MWVATETATQPHPVCNKLIMANIVLPGSDLRKNFTRGTSFMYARTHDTHTQCTYILCCVDEIDCEIKKLIRYEKLLLLPGTRSLTGTNNGTAAPVTIVSSSQ